MDQLKKEYTYMFEKWTSDFLLIADVNISCENIFNHIESQMCIGRNRNEILNSKTSRVVSNSTICDITNRASLSMEDFDNLMRYYSPKHGEIIVDHTCLLKGYALDVFKEYLLNSGATRFIINFGGDILVHNYPTSITVSDHLSINLTNGCCFTSNNNKRPNHIPISTDAGDVQYNSVTVFSDNLISSPIICDLLATKFFSDQNFKIPESIYGNDYYVLYTDKDGYPMGINNSYYMASPWFNEKEVEIKKKMMRPFGTSDNVFDPQSTDHSKAYDVSPGTELAIKISKDNINKIKSSNTLVFPKNTDDLGTIFDMSLGLALGKIIIRYDDITDSYVVIDSKSAIKGFPDIHHSYTQMFRVSITNRVDALLLGYFYGNGFKNLAYDTTLPDNIMLSVNFPRIRHRDGKYELIKADQKEVR